MEPLEKLICWTLLFVILVIGASYPAHRAIAAGLLPGKAFYDHTSINTLRDNARMMIHDSISGGTRNITGAVLKSEIKTSTNTEPILRGPYGNYSGVYNHYSSNGAVIVKKAYFHRRYMYFKGQMLVVSPVPPQ